MTNHILEKRRKALENSFFMNLNNQKIEELRRQMKEQNALQDLKEASGISDEGLLKKLQSLQIHKETIAALILTPLVQVAWADGKMEKKERKAVLDAARKNGISDDSPAYALLQEWLQVNPRVSLFSAWKSYISELLSNLEESEIRGLKIAILIKTRSIAEAAGGFLGMGNKICQEEEAVLTEIESIFSS